ncbi:hypothetical protein J1605_023119 [Eschrichtius robustus]|uniref:Uncharacterized protein n=1 Tax=Eschrichtius robustus TaxID=9764 RepID=A0AB34H7C6_ESCRO|nr:hypothetical protein J1605_023119 [Eschrichtius robustus]
MYTLTFSECCHVALRVAILRPAEPSIAVGEKALQRSLAKAYGGPEAGGQKPHQVGHKKPGLLGTESLWPLVLHLHSGPLAARLEHPFESAFPWVITWSVWEMPPVSGLRAAPPPSLSPRHLLPVDRRSSRDE